VLDIHWTLTVNVPQLDALVELGGTLVDTVQAIKDEMARLAEGQAQQTEVLATQLEAIKDEIAQFSAQDITQAQLDNLLSAVSTAADTAHKQAADIRANTEQIRGIVPDDATPA
jgi:septal ring factor EnvC (AmiA/AmiB activator)